MDDIIGTDVSNDRLDVHRLTDGSNCQFPNGTADHSKLLKWLETLPSLPLVIYEATGAYHRQLERRLGAKALAFVKVNPKQARRFAQASGKLAKTDRVPSRACKHTLPGSGQRNAGKDGRGVTVDAKDTTGRKSV